MAFAIGINEQQPLKRCPRPGCQTRQFNMLATGGRRWYLIPLSWIYNTETDLDSTTCNVWFDISRTKLPRLFQFPVAEDVFKQIRAERKWFKNVRIFPSGSPSLPYRANGSGHNEEFVKPKSVLSVPTAKNKIMEHLVTHLSPHRAFESTSSFPRLGVSQEIAAKAVVAVAEIIEMPEDELREMCCSDPHFIHCLGLDSLLKLEIMFAIMELGIEIPEFPEIVHAVFANFLQSFLMECFDAVDEIDIISRWRIEPGMTRDSGTVGE